MVILFGLLFFTIHHQNLRGPTLSSIKQNFLELKLRHGLDYHNHARMPRRIERKSQEAPYNFEMPYQRKAPGWWRNMTLVQQELIAFNTKFTNCKSALSIPPESKLRAHAGGMELIHAIRMQGGVASFRAKLLKEANGSNVLYDSSEHAELSSQARAKQVTSLKPKSASYGRFLKNNSEFFRKELIAFNQNYTNNIYRNIMPSLAQLRHGNRRDLINAIDRCGGR
jgi:hypothetical protein